MHTVLNQNKNVIDIDRQITPKMYYFRHDVRRRARESRQCVVELHHEREHQRCNRKEWMFERWRPNNPAAPLSKVRVTTMHAIYKLVILLSCAVLCCLALPYLLCLVLSCLDLPSFHRDCDGNPILEVHRQGNEVINIVVCILTLSLILHLSLYRTPKLFSTTTHR